MKFTLTIASALLLGATAEDLALGGNTTLGSGYDQLGNGVICLANATTDAALSKTGGSMDFSSDSVNMCARACDCRQGCLSFNWVKPDSMATDATKTFSLPPDTANLDDQGKCTLFSSDCGTASQTTEGDTQTYAFRKTSMTNTDVQLTYPRSGAATEKEVTDQVYCVMAAAVAADGAASTAAGKYYSIGDGGAQPGVCASGGNSAKMPEIDSQVVTGGTVDKCKALCEGDATCKMFNIGNGACKFRKQRCQTAWVSGDTHPYTTYIKGSAMIPDATNAPSPGPVIPSTTAPTTKASTFSGAATTGVGVITAVLMLAACVPWATSIAL